MTLLALLCAGLLDQARPALDAIHGAALSAHVRFLADDLLEGRRTGERGHAIAERYVATQLAALGARPAGEDGTYYQEVRLREGKLDPARTALAIEGAKLALLDDYVVRGDGASEAREVSGALLEVGFGLAADLEGKDLRGRIAVLRAGAPPSSDPLQRALASSLDGKLAALQAQGAVGALLLSTADTESRSPWSFAQRGFRSGSTRLDGQKATLPAAVLSRAAAERLGAAGKLDGRRARIAFAAAYRAFTSRNVAALLPGASPEVVVFSAHLDHLGRGEPVRGDAIYNGAIDNALGIADLLEIARGLAVLGARGRSVLFLAFTGEELGLLGSAWFVQHPTLPLERMVADLNMDQLLPGAPPREVVLRGAELSSLEQHVRAAAGALGLAISPDPVPEQAFYIRSDQYEFAKVGVPSACLWQGFAGGEEQAFRDFRANKYHQPSDEWSAAYDWEAAAQMARLELLTGISLLSGPRPAWKPGAPFGAARQPPTPAR